MSRTAPRPEIELGLAQNSRDKLPVKFRLGRLETTTKALVRLKACPTMPGAKVAPFSSVPLFPATISDVLPSPGHQPTIPAGAGTHWAAAEGPKRTTLTDSPVPTNIEAYFVFIVCLALNIWRRACRRTTTDRRRHRASAANPVSAEPGASKTETLGGGSVERLVRLFYSISRSS